MVKKFNVYVLVEEDLYEEIWAADEQEAYKEMKERILEDFDNYIYIEPIESELTDEEKEEIEADRKLDYLLGK